MEITTAMVKELREATGAGVLDCRKALEATGGDFEAAVAYLREKGLAEAAKKMDRLAKEGVIEAYVHTGNRVGVILELNCETDFVARTEEFRRLAHDLALHIAFAAPRYLSRNHVPAEVVEEERRIYRAQALEEGKPEHVVDRIVQGKLEKFYQSVCLLEQPFVKDEERTVEQILKEHTALLGENIVVRRFVRYELGEGM
ncbi:MAG: translation elongation factor Ts [Anaerolineae bacterium]|nr:translation elongation factor Ts [Anaerolineae bacterium]MCX8067918.1 translation elongation factor Ts [Anaerolineae bacterium]MDW7992377.1 translation elongation factor Ts [Anaerolineae bacterium]